VAIEQSNLNAKNSERSPSARGNRTWEHRLVWLLLLSIAGLLAYFHLIGRVDSQLTREITRVLRREFPRHHVSVDRARLISGQSITIDGLRIAQPTDQGLRDVVRMGRVTCNGPIDLVGLAQGQLPVESVVVDSLDVSLWPLSSGRWNIEDFSGGKPLPKRFPSIQVRSGLIRIGHETGGAGREIICHDLQVDMARGAATAGDASPAPIAMRASVSSSYFHQAQVQGWLAQDKSSWSLSGAVSRLEYSTQLVDQVPACLREQLQVANGFSGEVEMAFQVAMRSGQIQFESNASVRNGRLLHPLVPYPLDSMAFDVYCKNALLQLRHGSARSGEAEALFNCDVQGFALGSPLVATLQVQNLALDDRLYQALPPNIQEHWKRMGVSGLVDASAAVEFDGEKWNPRILVRARDGRVDPDFFPYPVRHIQGDFLYENGCISAPELTAMAGQQTLSGSLTLQRAQPRWLMDLIIAADGPIAIDEPLLRALTPRGAPPSGFHRFISSLHPTGTVLLRRGRFTRSAAQPETISRSLELTFSECTVKYDGFRYPIVDVHGQATLDNDRLILREFVGRNDGARIKGEGFGLCHNSNLDSIDLIFNAYDVSLDEELYGALPASARNLWEQLQPNGTIDRLGIQIKRDHTHDPLDLRVEMTEEIDAHGSGARGISFRPLAFPYVIDDVACSIDYRPGRIDIRSLSGVHDLSRIQTEGQIRLHGDGSWDGQLQWLPSTRFLVDQVLLGCLPPILRDPLTRMQFRGPVGITGTTRIASLDEMQPSLVRSWMLSMELEDAQFGGNFASGVRGSIQVSGENTATGPIAYGSMAIDALAIKNIAVTGLEGPFAMDRSELLLGRDAMAWQAKNHATIRPMATASAPGDPNVVPASFRSRVLDALAVTQPTTEPAPMSAFTIAPPVAPTLDIRDSDLRARTLSGTLFLSGVEPLNGDRSRYRVRLVDADFHGFLVDLGETHTQASGRLSVQCDLSGSLYNTEALEGSGRAWLRGANLYELPAMIRLFRLLSVRPDQGAFDSADIAFTIDGDRIPVHELELDGDLVSMRGSGWVNLRRELYLDLYAHVGRRSLVGAMVRPLTQHRAANLMRIEVSGSTSDPQMKRSMPLMESLEQVLPETP
jgi:hypothetical protein